MDPRLVDESTAKKLELSRASGGHESTATHTMAASSSYPEEHDRASVGSNDSGGSDHLGEGRGETPLLPPDEQGGGYTSVTITVREYNILSFKKMCHNYEFCIIPEYWV